MNLNRFRHFYLTRLPLVFFTIGGFFLLLAFGPLLFSEVWYQFNRLKKQEYRLNLNNNQESTTSFFGKLLGSQPIYITPVNKGFAIVIEKLDINAPIVKDVSVLDQDSYRAALQEGVAHSSYSDYPSAQPGNVYLFAHASLNFWELGKYATVFNLIRKLEDGDKINIFYENRMYIYKVVNTEVYPGWDTRPLTREVIEPVLTLQTCDPPGTTLNRLVVTAVLQEEVLLD
jgi:sortase A